MRRRLREIVRVLVAMSASLTVVACSTARRGLLEVGAALPATEDTALIQRHSITFDATQLTPGESTELALPLPEQRIRINVAPIPAESLSLPKGQSAWLGTTTDGSEFFIMRIGRGYEAQLTTPKWVYRIRTVDGSKGVLEIYDAQRFREARNDGISGPESRTRGPSGDASCTDPASRIDIMVLYTPSARDTSGGIDEIENEVAFAVGRANLAYANGNASHRLNLIYTGLANFTEPSAGVDSNALLSDLQDTSDGVLDTVHGTRDSVKADLVSLFYEKDDDGWCGWGHTVENANADTTDHRAFTVVRRSCAGGYLSFAHEVGHNLGARHDRDNAGTSSLGYNFGHIEPDPSSTLAPWRTVMAYPDPCGSESATGTCQRVAWFSNPNVSRSGDPTGVPLTDTDPEHNVNVFAQNDGHVTRYRCLRKDVAGPDVWMKDRWEDTGGEPDPATTGKAMWQSPYIWVRRSEDTSLEHEHEHEDPRLGITNHVYVKIHNDGATSQSGSLELYFAAASTNLNDPSSWTQIDSKSQTLAPGVEVVHSVWNGLPGEGHYCLLARWNEDGSTLSFTNLGAAVRNDNDLIWRNVNIIDLSGDIDASTGDFFMAGDREFRDTFLVLETGPKNTPNVDWPKLVQVRVTIDPAALANAQPFLQNLTPLGGHRYLIPIATSGTRSWIGPFRLAPRQKTKISLDFEIDREAVGRAVERLDNAEYFDITASQVVPASHEVDPIGKSSNMVLGGVTFSMMVPARK